MVWKVKIDKEIFFSFLQLEIRLLAIFILKDFKIFLFKKNKDKFLLL